MRSLLFSLVISLFVPAVAFSATKENLLAFHSQVEGEWITSNNDGVVGYSRLENGDWEMNGHLSSVYEGQTYFATLYARYRVVENNLYYVTEDLETGAEKLERVDVVSVTPNALETRWQVPNSWDYVITKTEVRGDRLLETQSTYSQNADGSESYVDVKQTIFTRVK